VIGSKEASVDFLQKELAEDAVSSVRVQIEKNITHAITPVELLDLIKEDDHSAKKKPPTSTGNPANDRFRPFHPL
jgi:hypothetical protein